MRSTPRSDQRIVMGNYLQLETTLRTSLALATLSSPLSTTDLSCRRDVKDLACRRYAADEMMIHEAFGPEPATPYAVKSYWHFLDSACGSCPDLRTDYVYGAMSPTSATTNF